MAIDNRERLILDLGSTGNAEHKMLRHEKLKTFPDFFVFPSRRGGISFFAIPYISYTDFMVHVIDPKRIT